MFVIFYNFRRGLSLQECIDKLKSLFGDKAPFHSTVKNWFTEFNCGRRPLNYELHEGRPKTAVVPENIDAVREQDCHVTYHAIKASFDISSTSIHSILPLFSLDSVQLDNRPKKGSCRLVLEMLEKYDRGASKDVYKIVTGDESWIYAYESTVSSKSS